MYGLIKSKEKKIFLCIKSDSCYLLSKEKIDKVELRLE